MLGTLNMHGNLVDPLFRFDRKGNPVLRCIFTWLVTEMNLYLTTTLIILFKADTELLKYIFKFRTAIGSYLKNDHGVRFGQKILVF